MRTYKLVIFDFDGTLADSFPWFAGVLNDLARTHGFRELTVEEREALRGAPARDILKGFGVPLWRVPAIAADLRARKAKAAGQIPLFDGVPETLGRLRDRGVALAIVSSDSEASIRVGLGASAGLISHWACGAALFGKAAKFTRVRKAAGASAEQTICVGDEDRDASAAAEAGLDFGAVSWGFATREILAARRPAQMFDCVEDLLRIAG